MCRRELSCFLLLLRWGPQMSLLSSSRPRYLASLERRIIELLKETSGQSLGSFNLEINLRRFDLIHFHYLKFLIF
jgi:hypothetical protein